MRKYFLSLLSSIIFLSGCGLYVPKSAPSLQPSAISNNGMQYPRYAEIANPSGFINTSPNSSGKSSSITISDQIGKKVVLLDFMTYTCINCIRTFPYLNAWYDKYKDQGLEIIGIHTPEFAFEHKYDNVVEAMKQYGIKFPVVLDNDYATWNAYGNQYWPRKYLIDINGNIVYDHIGEGDYEETEMKIKELLEERMDTLGMKDGIDEEIARPADIFDVEKKHPISRETYFGSARNEFFGNGKPGQSGEEQFTLPYVLSDVVKANTLYLSGRWNITSEYAEARGDSASIVFRYQASHVYLVMSSDESVILTITRDGQPLGDVAGKDVKVIQGQSTVTVDNEQLYELVDEAGYGEHTLEIKTSAPGVRAFAFTFG